MIAVSGPPIIALLPTTDPAIAGVLSPPINATTVPRVFKSSFNASEGLGLAEQALGIHPCETGLGSRV